MLAVDGSSSSRCVTVPMITLWLWWQGARLAAMVWIVRLASGASSRIDAYALLQLILCLTAQSLCFSFMSVCVRMHLGVTAVSTWSGCHPANSSAPHILDTAARPHLRYRVRRYLRPYCTGAVSRHFYATCSTSTPRQNSMPRVRD